MKRTESVSPSWTKNSAALGQLRGFAKGFRHLVACLGRKLQLLVATGSESRHRLYCRFVHHAAVMKLSLPEFAIRIEPYQVRSATKSLQLIPLVNSGELATSSPTPAATP